MIWNTVKKNLFFSSKIFVLFFIVSLAFISFASPSHELKVIYPREGARLPFLKRSFVYGSVKPASATVLMNGTTIQVYPSGSYVGMIDFLPGKFPISVQSFSESASSEVVRTIHVSSPPVPIPPDIFTIDLESIEPFQDRVVISGDTIPLGFRGTPGCRAEYRFIRGTPSKEVPWKEMRESPSFLGSFYETSEQILPIYKEEEFLVEYRLTRANKQKKVAHSPGRIKVLPRKIWGIAKVVGEEAVIRSGPSIGSDSMGYDLFLLEGTPLVVDGQIGSEVRVYLSPTLRGWIPRSHLSEIRLEHGIPRAILSSIRARAQDNKLSLNFFMSSKVPYKVTLGEDLKSFTVTFFYSVSNLDRVRYDEEGLLKNLSWIQKEENTVEVQCHIKDKVWGYHLKYEGNTLILELENFKFMEKKKKKKQLEGFTIAVDPGHSSRLGDGTISPQGILEGDYNFTVALQLKKKLEAAGAKVVLTREDGKGVSLEDRKKKAVDQNAQLYLSIHGNAVGDGANPLEHRGYSFYYFYPQSLDLARALNGSFHKTLSLPEDGIYYGNLAVCRMTQMPSVLVETGYLIHPLDEMLLLDSKFQDQLTQSILDGVLRFLREW